MATYRFDEIAINSTKKKKPTEEDKVHYIGLEHIDPGCFNIVRWGSDVAPTGDKLLMQKGDVLFGKRRAYQRKVGIAPFDGIFSAHGMVLRPNTEIIDANYFPFFISSDRFMETAVRISVGGLSPTINWKDLAKQKFDLPTLEEQKVLADKLWAAYRLKEGYKKLLAATDEMVKSQFIEMTTRSELNKKSIGEIAEVRTGSTPSRSNPEYWNGTHYWVSAQDMGNKYIYDTLEKITDKGYATCKVVPAGSILYVCRGSIGVMSINTMDCATNQSICTATCKKGYNTEYLYYALKVAEKTIKKQGIGTSFKSLNQSAFSSIEILFPAIEIQDKFAAIAKQADKSKSYVRIALKNLESILGYCIRQVA